jgi:hypothetical protein
MLEDRWLRFDVYIFEKTIGMMGTSGAQLQTGSMAIAQVITYGTNFRITKSRTYIVFDSFKHTPSSNYSDFRSSFR